MRGTGANGETGLGASHRGNRQAGDYPGIGGSVAVADWVVL